MSKVDSQSPNRSEEKLSLRNCPFCGGLASMIYNDGGNWHVQCDDCWTKAGEKTYDSQEAAARNWNARDESQVDPDKAEIVRLRSVLQRCDVQHSADRDLIARLRAALLIADRHFRVIYPRGAEEGDYLCAAVRAASEMKS